MASTKDILQKTFILASGLAFLGMMTLPMINIFTGGGNAPSSETEANQGPNPAEQEQLLAIAQGYEKVLEREPENSTALQGLVSTRLELRDLPGMVPPLEKLVKLYPDNQQYQDLLAAVKQQLALLQNLPSAPEGDTVPPGTAQPLPRENNNSNTPAVETETETETEPVPSPAP